MERIEPGKDDAIALYTSVYAREGVDWSARDALEHAVDFGWSINKYADPTQGSLEDMSVEEALEVEAEDSRLLWLSRKGESECVR